MNTEEYEKMFRQEEYFWWFCGRLAIVESMLRHHTPFGEEGRQLTILDVGCGTGKILRKFESMGHRVIGLDFSELALKFSADRGAKNLVRGDAEQLPFGDNQFDLVVSLDIMEHVQGDQAMADELFRVLKPGGHLILNVPAHPGLWSNHDVALHHFRRYTRDTLRQVLNEPGFEKRRFTYSVCSPFPVAVVFRRISKLLGRDKAENPRSDIFELPGIFNKMLIGLLKSEAALMRYMNMPMGLSLLALMQKPTLPGSTTDKSSNGAHLPTT